MKKCFLSLGLIVAAMFTLTNCTEQIDAPVEPAKVPFEIIASTAETKTTNDGMSTEWSTDDAINLFHAINGSQEYANDGMFSILEENLDIKKFTGTINGELDSDATYDLYAFYPYTSYISTPANSNKGWVEVGSKSSEAQVQNGINSTTHIAGPYYPLAGVVKGVKISPQSPVQIDMSHVTALLEFVVKNDTKDPLTVTNISFTATENVVGRYYIDFTDTENLIFTSSDVNKVSAVAKLNVLDADPIPAGGSAKFYMAVKPFTAASGQKLTIMINDCEKEKILAKDITFSAGKIKTINCSYTAPESVLTGIAGIKSAADEAGAEGGTFVADVEDAVVTYVYGSNAYVQDATAGILIYASGHGLEVGNVLNGRISGTVKIYNNLREITSFTSSATVTDTEDIPVTILTITELNANQDKYENMRVKLVGVEVTDDGKLSKEDASVTYYKKNKNAAGLNTYNLVDVVGYPGKYNEAFQFNVWEDAEVKGATQTTISGFSTEITVGVEASVPNKATASSGANVSYESANTAIAAVDEEGNITGVSAGTTTITASVVEYNGYPAASVTCNVTVTADAPAEPKVVFEETFAGFNGTMGWTGSVASGKTTTTDNSGWTLVKAYGADGAAKLGTSSEQGSAETPELNFEGSATLTFKAGAWAGDKTTLNISMTGGTLSQTSVTMEDSDWTEYEITITNATVGAKIKFEGYQASKARFFLDDVKITQ